MSKQFKVALVQRSFSGKIDWASSLHYLLDRNKYISKLYRTPTGWWLIHWVLWRHNPFYRICTECNHAKFAHEWSWGWESGYGELGKTYCNGNQSHIQGTCDCGYHCGR